MKSKSGGTRTSQGRDWHTVCGRIVIAFTNSTHAVGPPPPGEKYGLVIPPGRARGSAGHAGAALALGLLDQLPVSFQGFQTGAGNILSCLPAQRLDPLEPAFELPVAGP